MTIEEIKQAKAEAEARIQQELQQLQERTGMEVAEVRARFVDFTEVSCFRRRAVADVQIDLRVPWKEKSWQSNSSWSHCACQQASSCS